MKERLEVTKLSDQVAQRRYEIAFEAVPDRECHNHGSQYRSKMKKTLIKEPFSIR